MYPREREKPVERKAGFFLPRKTLPCGATRTESNFFPFPFFILRIMLQIYKQ